MPRSPKRGMWDGGCWMLPLLTCALSVAAAQNPTSHIPPPTSDSAAFFRALDLEGAGKYREAAALFRQALNGSQSVSALLGLERSYAELQWIDSLLAPLDTLIRRNPR